MSEKKGLNRRDFLKIGGMATVTVPAAVAVGNVGKKEFVSSAQASTGFYIKELDEPPYKIDMSIYKRPSGMGMIGTIMGGSPPGGAPGGAGPGGAGPGGAGPGGRAPGGGMGIMGGYRDEPGFTRLDSAFNSAAASMQNVLKYNWEPLGRGMTTSMMGGGNLADQGPWDPAEDGYSPQEVTHIVKKAAKFYGASSAGIAMVDERWFMATAMPDMEAMRHEQQGDGPPDMAKRQEMMKKMMNPPPIVFSDEEDEPHKEKDGKQIIPKSMKYAIVMAIEMDGDIYSCKTSSLTMAASMNGYSRMAFTAPSLAEFIRNLGYKAIPMGNDSAMSQPMAVDAGLGEMSRAGLLITPKYGARVRLCKVITDMPLIPDKPISFGVWEFCHICGKCAEACPSKSIPNVDVKPSYDAPASGNPGVLKWAVNGTSCMQQWMQQGAECHICIRVCPFTKPDGWLHDITKTFIGVRSDSLNKLILKMDDAAGFGPPKGRDPREYWRETKTNFIHIKT